MRLSMSETSQSSSPQQTNLSMPHRIDITDQVAKESKDSNASDHPIHTGEKAKAEHHQANPGPVMAENLGQPASKEELKKRAEELNK